MALLPGGKARPRMTFLSCWCTFADTDEFEVSEKTL
jgi:hypothetical protein